ncbi:apolipoprotein L3-like [Hyperolius riggenbachi]|uniref:apolipoprotein L3-like n=1 Tax=Hyperolius riggenbachi TaxID=752182 RepID=UPI0035A33022
MADSMETCPALNDPENREREMMELEERMKQYVKEFLDTLTELRDQLGNCTQEMRSIADDMDEFHKKATIASVAGSAVGIAGGLTTLAGLVLAPFTLGTSLTLSAIGITTATAGGVTGAAASIADTISTKNKLSRVEEIVTKANKKIEEMKKISEKIDKELNNWQCNLSSNEDTPEFARIGGRFGFAGVEAARVARLIRISEASAQGTKVAMQGGRTLTALSGIFAGLFIFVDAYFVFKGAKDLQNGGKTKEAKDIRLCATELQGVQHSLQNREEELKKECEWIPSPST